MGCHENVFNITPTKAFGPAIVPLVSASDSPTSAFRFLWQSVAIFLSYANDPFKNRNILIPAPMLPEKRDAPASSPKLRPARKTQKFSGLARRLRSEIQH